MYNTTRFSMNIYNQFFRRIIKGKVCGNISNYEGYKTCAVSRYQHFRGVTIIKRYLHSSMIWTWYINNKKDGYWITTPKHLSNDLEYITFNIQSIWPIKIICYHFSNAKIIWCEFKIFMRYFNIFTASVNSPPEEFVKP